MTTTVYYDGTFDGFMTAVFEVYEYKISEPEIVVSGKAGQSLFGQAHTVQTDLVKSKRVLEGLRQKISRASITQLYKSFLSEMNGMEAQLFGFIRYVMANKLSVENDYSNAHVLYLQQTSRKVHREKHRMEAFIRFQQTKDNLYYSIIQPDFNVLPLIWKHFKNRYADQRWLIYDTRRKYGMYYDLHTVEEVSLDFNTDMQNSNAVADIHDEREELYQQLWRQYFSSVNIAARKNTRLHIRHMPKRYWRYLTEKSPALSSIQNEDSQ